MKKEELIDFLVWYKIQPIHIRHSLDATNTVDLYIKSINSSTSDEALTLDNNEQKEKKCHSGTFCIDINFERYKDCNSCPKWY